MAGVLPAVLTGYYFGAGYGAAAGVILFLLNVFMLAASGYGWEIIQGSCGIAGSLVIVMLGALAGHMKRLHLFMVFSRNRLKQIDSVSIGKKVDFKSIFEAAGDCLIYLDDTGNVTDVNREAARVLGKSRKDLVGSYFMELDIFPPEETPRLVNAFSRCFTGERPSLCIELRKDAGDSANLECTFNLMELDGKAGGVMVIARDTAETHKMKDALSEIEEKYRKIIEIAPDAIFFLHNGRCIDCNRKAEEFFAGRREEMMGKQLWELSPDVQPGGERSAEVCRDKIKLAIDGIPQLFEWEFRGLKGNEFSSEVHLYSLQFKKQIYIIAIIRDITERKTSEKMLFESEQRFRETADLLSTIICEFDLDMRITYVNNAGLSIFEYSQEDIDKGLFVRDFIHPTEYKLAKERIARAIKGEKLIAKQYTMIKKDGSFIKCIVNTAPMYREGKVIGLRNALIDVTDYSLIKDRLDDYMTRMDYLSKNTPDILMTIDRKGTILGMNRSVIGRPVTEIIGTSIYEYISHEFHKKIRSVIREVLKTGNMGEYETVGQGSGGAVRWYRTRVIPVKEKKNGVVSQMIQICSDITEYKEKEKRLKESEEMYKNLIKTSPNAVSLTDLEGKLLYVSSKTLELHGYDEESEMLGMDAFLLLAPHERARGRKQVEELLKNGYVENREYVLLRRNGSVFTGDLNASVIRDAEGNPLCLIATTRDITEKKEKQNELIKSEKKMRAILEAIPDLMFQISADGIFLSYKASKEDLYTDPKYFLNNNIRDVLPKEVAELTMEEIGKALETDEVQVFEYFLEMNKKVYYYEARVIPSGDNAVLAIVRDITERKEADKEIQQALREKKFLIREIHQRVKNNMQVVSTMINIQAGQIENEEIRGLLRESLNRIQSMILVNEKLYYSKDLMSVDFDDYIRTITEELFRYHDADDKNIMLEIDAQKMMLDVDYALPCGLIISELVSNSIKHAFEKKKKNRIGISISRTDDEYELIIEDNGMGLPGDFDIRRAETIGLCLVNQLVEEQLHGDIHISCEKGCRFVIRFG
ncbi:MAG: PAS domain S-box protein [Elusimicrobia bacterium]|nr:PAS domain S-box protein [Elusimicrobiota bacterium]